MRRFTININQS